MKKNKMLLFMTLLLCMVMISLSSCSSDKDVSVTGLSLNKSSLTLQKGTTETLVATISPEDASNKDILWTSNDETVATVSPTGEINALKSGTTTITAQSIDGNYTASCQVTVFVTVTGITLDKKELSITEGKTLKLIPTISPEDATNKEIKWTSSDNAVASVSTNGEITTYKPGTVTINATTTDQHKTATCKISVTSAENIDYNPYGDKQEW